MTLNDRAAVGTLNPYCRNEAETICREYGIKTEAYIELYIKDEDSVDRINTLSCPFCSFAACRTASDCNRNAL